MKALIFSSVYKHSIFLLISLINWLHDCSKILSEKMLSQNHRRRCECDEGIRRLARLFANNSIILIWGNDSLIEQRRSINVKKLRVSIIQGESIPLHPPLLKNERWCDNST